MSDKLIIIFLFTKEIKEIIGYVRFLNDSIHTVLIYPDRLS